MVDAPVGWLCLLVAALLVVTLVGHGIWELVVLLLHGPRRPRVPFKRRAGGRDSCPGCGRPASGEEERCLECGLLLDSPAARELADLTATSRQMDRFERTGFLNRVILDRLRSAVRARRDHLRRGRPEDQPLKTAFPAAPASKEPLPTSPEEVIFGIPVAEALPEPPPAVAPAPVLPPPWKRLERLLTGCRDAGRLMSGERVQALLWLGQSPEEEIARLAPAAQGNLARLLLLVNRNQDALRAFRRLLVSHPQDPECAEAALEAGRLAFRAGQREEAAWFLEQALARSLPPHARNEAEFLLRRLRPAPEPVREEVAPAAPPPRRPRRSLGSLLAAFMEERNILWGEVVGGLLIVGCSIALVLSLWRTLEGIPYFPFFIIAGTTAALFGAGFYTLHHWKLESTSRGLLVIATLLVPLSFWVMAGLEKQEVTDPQTLLILGASLALFGWLLHGAGRVLAPDGRWLLPLAVLGASASQLMVPGLLEAAPADLGLFLLVGFLPVLFHGLGVGGMLRRTGRHRPLEASHTRALFALLGIASFALAVTLGFVSFVASWEVGLGTTLNRLAPLLALAGIPVLACGALVHRRLEAPVVSPGASEEAGTSLAILRTIGTAVLLSGVLVMLAGVVLAWPEPVALVVVCALNFAVLTGVAFRFRLFFAHAAAIPCIAIGLLTGLYVLTGNLAGVPEDQLGARWLHLTFSGWGGAALALPVALVALTSEVLVHTGRRLHGAWYALGSGVLALASGILVCANGLDVPERAALVSAFYGAGCLAVNLRWRRPGASYFGLVLPLTATAWILEAAWPILGTATIDAGRLGLWAAVFAAAGAVLAGLAAFLSRGRLGIHLDSSGPGYLVGPATVVCDWVAALAAGLGMGAGLSLPWQGAIAATGLFLLLEYVVLAAAGKKGAARLAGELLIVTVIAGAGWVAVRAGIPDLWPFIGLCLTGTSTLMAGVSLWATRGWPWSVEVGGEEAPAAPPWWSVFALAWREMSVVAGVLGLALAFLPAGDFGSGLQTGSLAAAGLTAFLLAWRYQQPAVSWVGSALVLASILNGLYGSGSLADPLDRLLVALLAHATAGIVAGLGGRTWWPGETGSADRILYRPWLDSALAATVLTLPLLALVRPGHLGLLAGCSGWLAVLWFVVAWAKSSPGLFTAFQAAAAVAVLQGVAAWLVGQPWVAGHYPEGLADPRSLQAFGIGLSLWALAWRVARLGLPKEGRAQKLLEPAWPALDRVALGGLVIFQFLLAVWAIIPGVLQELTPLTAELFLPAWPAATARALGPGAWAWLGILALVLVLFLREKPRGAVPGLLALAVTLPILVAGTFAAERAAASALRWGLAACFLVCSALLWLRVPLGRLLERYVLPGPQAFPRTAAVRRLALLGLVLPVLALTAATVALPFLGEQARGPLAGSFFHTAGILFSTGVPLALIGVALVGHAVRERSAGFAFGAGVVVNLTLVLEYALAFVEPGGYLAPLHWVRLFQWGAAGAAVCALAWLGCRRWLPASSSSRFLLRVQIGISLAGSAVLLLGGMVFLVLSVPSEIPVSGGAFYRAVPDWVKEVGSWRGWLALGLAGFAAHVAQVWGTIRFSLRARRWVALGVVALLACTVERLGPGWGYRTLMLGAATLAFAAALGVREAAGWIRFLGILVLLLGFKAAVLHQDQPWAARAILLASLAGAVYAVKERREEWAFSAGLGINVAATFLVWHAHLTEPLETWWVLLLQANVMANALGTLTWLEIRRSVFRRAEPESVPTPYLAVQVGLGLLVHAILLLTALGWLFAVPGDLIADLGDIGSVPGWLALALTAVATGWYLREGGRSLFSPAVALGLAVGTLAACAVSPLDQGNWLSYHVLTVSWVLAGVAILGSWLVRPSGRLGTIPGSVQSWVIGISLAVVALALRGAWEDPERPYWSGAATFIVSGLTGILAFYFQRPAYIYLSGLVGDLAGILLWLAWGPGTLASFLVVLALGLGITSAFWSVVELKQAARFSPPEGRVWLPPYRHVAVLVGLVCIGVTVLAALAVRLTGVGWQLDEPLAGTALAAVTGSLALCLWDARARFTPAGLYLAGLAALGLFLYDQFPSPTWLGWNAALLLAGYVLLTSVIASLGRERFQQILRLPAAPSRREPWFRPCQLLGGALAAGLSVWIAADFASVRFRLAGPLAMTFLLAAGVLLARAATAGWGKVLRVSSLVLGALIPIEVGWVLLNPALPAPWLHREVILMVALAGTAFLYGVVLARFLAGSAWGETGRRVGRWLGLGAVLATASVLVHEAYLYDLAAQTTPLAGPGVVAVALALVVLMAAAILFAVVPGRDPLGLSEKRRPLYVYACEALLVVLFVHLRLNVPWLFGHFFTRYWAALLMALSFLGVGLGEFFLRRGLPALAEPLRRTGVFLPLFPLLVFWLQPSAALREFVRENAPAVVPLLNVLKRPPGGFPAHALLWFSLGLLYAVVALARRSFRFAFLAALAANFGLWTLLYHHGHTFLAHPQFWVIPLALIVLVSEHLNRDRLSRPQAVALRYLALGMLYVSSTADMFITGVGNSVALPLVLALLSVLGVLAGILLRVRAFLFLGVGFLVLVIFSMIWHAAVDLTHTWVWWASGIALGLAILALFALFEKRRNEVLRLIEEIKEWD